MIWPQVLLGIMFAVELGMQFGLHGTEKKDKTHNAWFSLVSIGMIVTLLWFGGFWGRN